ncbi:MAG: hypothetical protein IKJ59_15825 [Clostridia bacterium]|nr:hypothetical protein [Clostridia bacterium]
MSRLINTGDVATDVATNLIEDGIKFAWNKVQKYFKDINTQQNILLGIAYETYLLRTKEKYGKIKTILYNHIREELYSFYVNVNLKYGDNIVDSSDINNVINLTNKIIITGTGGIGKSTLMHHFFLNTIDNTNYIPVLIELRSVELNQQEDPIKEAIYNALKNNGFNLEKEYFEYSLNEGGYIILLDGYDEVKKDVAGKITKSIQDFSDKYHKNKFIVSSRPSREFIGWEGFDELTSIPLSKEQAIELISKIKYDETVKDKFLKELDNTLYDKHKSFAENPLLLTIMLLTFESNAKIPETLNDFYERAFNVLFREHDALKDVYERETCTKLSYEKFKLIFSYICFISYIQNEYEFTDVTLLNYLQKAQDKFPDILFDSNDFQQDLLQHVCMLVKDGLSYRFVHRSFQEYFAAVYTTSRLIDDKQVKLFKTKLSKDIINHETYYKMLYDMQPERFINNILLPGLAEIKEKNGNDKFTLKTLDILFIEFVIRKISSDNKLYLVGVISMDEENKDKIYYSNIYYLCKFLNLSKNTVSEEQKNNIDLIIRKHFDVEKLINNEYISKPINELPLFNDEELNSVFFYQKNMFLYGMEILNRYSKPSSNELTISSLIEEL